MHHPIPIQRQIKANYYIVNLMSILIIKLIVLFMQVDSKIEGVKYKLMQRKKLI